MLARLVAAGKFEDVKKLLDSKANVNDRDENSQTGLHVAAQLGKLDIIQLFLQRKKLDINAQDEHGWTALHWAANKGKSEICQVLISHKNIKPFLPNDDFNTPFLYLCRSRIDENSITEFKKILQAFVVRGVDINERNRFGESPLHYAIISSNTEAVEFLCQNKCNINALNKLQEILLLFFFRFIFLKKIFWIIFSLYFFPFFLGNFSNLKFQSRGETPLNYAVRGGKVELVKLLLEHGAYAFYHPKDPNSLDHLTNNEQIKQLIKGFYAPSLSTFSLHLNLLLLYYFHLLSCNRISISFCWIHSTEKNDFLFLLLQLSLLPSLLFLLLAFPSFSI